MTKSFLPVSLFFAVSLVLSNKAYIYLAVSYIQVNLNNIITLNFVNFFDSVCYINVQMLKAFTPVAVLIFSFVAGLEQPSYTEVHIVLIICVGVALTSVGESFFSWTGFTFQSLAILAESSRLVLTNLLMKQLKLDPLSSLYYIAPLCAVFTGLACLIFEFQDLPFERMQTTDFLVIMLVNGIVAFTLNVAVVLLISNTSALVLTLAGIIKDILLVVLSVTVFGSPVTPLQYAGTQPSLHFSCPLVLLLYLLLYNFPLYALFLLLRSFQLNFLCIVFIFMSAGYGLALLGLNLHKEYKKSPERITQLLTYLLSCGIASRT